MRRVSKEEFERFLADYPRPLEDQLATIYEPPMHQYHDWSLGKYPESIVAAKSAAGWYRPDDESEYWLAN